MDTTPPTLAGSPPAVNAWGAHDTAPSTNGMSPFAIAKVVAVGDVDDVIVLVPAAALLGVEDVGDTGEVGVVGCSAATGEVGVAKDNCC